MRKYKIEGKQREKLPGDGVPFLFRRQATSETAKPQSPLFHSPD